MSNERALLIAVPVRRSLHPGLRSRALALATRAEKDETNRAFFPGGVEMAFFINSQEANGDVKFAAQAAARNELLDRKLRPEHTHVFFVDADVTDYRPDLPSLLAAAAPDGIAAPIPLVEGRGAWFYDTLGFIENGARVRARPPYFDTSAEPIEITRTGDEFKVYATAVPLDSVGTCYTAAADILRAVRFASLPYDPETDHESIAKTNGHTDHWPIMRWAREHGRPILCLKSVKIAHANLPEWGERFH